MEVEDKSDEEGQLQHPKRDRRYYIARELLQTEKNYVSILTTIVKVVIVYAYLLECERKYGLMFK